VPASMSYTSTPAGRRAQETRTAAAARNSDTVSPRRAARHLDGIGRTNASILRSTSNFDY
jgi:hypothetical protein